MFEEYVPASGVSAATLLLLIVVLVLLALLGDLGLALRFIWICAVKPKLRRVCRQRLAPTESAKLFLSPLDYETSVSTHDLDLMGHMNNARYPREADFARHELFAQCGMFEAAWKRKMPLVTAAQSIRYRKELRFGQKYTIRSKVVGWDSSNLYIEQIFLTLRKHHLHRVQPPQASRLGRGDDGGGALHDEKYHIHCIMYVKEAIAVPKHRKGHYPLHTGGPLRCLVESLGWHDEVRCYEQNPPADFAKWLESLHEGHARVCHDLATDESARAS